MGGKGQGENGGEKDRAKVAKIAKEEMTGPFLGVLSDLGATLL